ncbi:MULTISPECIES: WXG100 family type VII secretion target [Catenuloplanes]|uniref:PE domain-containing protein n=1 Tax=Catenuloplanes niger TaxID=587534 RepID=A0AAE3ZMQ4_9ACTN|nr:hypothetical protein [Catenuloplanes niger]MDR7322612.1 hypothetical protein [Catenuloplanes niger]
MSGFEVDPESLRATDDRIGAVFQAALADFGRLEAETAAEDAPWGGDDLGMLIGEVYQGAYAMAFNCLYSNLDTMGDYSYQLAVVADAYDAVEEQIAQQLGQIGSTLG